MGEYPKQPLKKYQNLVSQKSPPRPILRNAITAFVVGGAICIVGQIILNQFVNRFKLDMKQAIPATSAAMVFLGALFTGFGIYDEIGKLAGMGAALPITGFANSVVSPAMEFKTEGYILGMSAKMFVIAGPVIVYGLCAAFTIGLIKLLVLP